MWRFPRNRSEVVRRNAALFSVPEATSAAAVRPIVASGEGAQGVTAAHSLGDTSGGPRGLAVGSADLSSLWRPELGD